VLTKESCTAFSALTLWLGGMKGIRPVKTEWWGAGVVVCLERGADLHMSQLMPLPLTVSSFSKIKIGFTFLVPAHPGNPGQRAVKLVCVCVCVPIYVIHVGRICREGRFFSLERKSEWVMEYQIAVSITVGRKKPYKILQLKCNRQMDGRTDAQNSSRFSVNVLEWRTQATSNSSLGPGQSSSRTACRSFCTVPPRARYTPAHRHLW